MKTKDIIINIKNLSFSYGETPALKNVTFSIAENDFFGIIGPNGGGKTTLLRIILGLETPGSGSVLVGNARPGTSSTLIGYVPQFAKFDFNFPIKVNEAVLTGRLSLAPLFGGYRKADRDAADEAMEAVGVSHLVSRHLGSLSGGERQRVLIARAIVSRPKVLLLDEPTAHVDLGAEESIYELLGKLNRDITIVMVSHDVGFITRYVKKVACINRTLVCHPAQKITAKDIEKLYHEPMHIVDHGKKI